MMIVFSDNDKQLCEAVAKHLQVITMIKEIGDIKVVPKDETKQYGSYGKFWVIVDDACRKFSITMQSVYNAATDFEAGYKAAKGEANEHKKV